MDNLLQQIECAENFNIINMTTFKIGGVVDRLYLPKNMQELVFLLKNLDEYILFGSCSNVLFSSSGYNGNVIITTKMNNYEIKGTSVNADCGVKGQTLSKAVSDAGLSGFEFMIGFPGTVGGEVYMNASAHGQSISDFLIRCCLFDTGKNEIVYKEKSEMNFSYRSSILQSGRYVLLGAEFELKKADKTEIDNLMNRNLECRQRVQPNLAYPNAGSVFKNPENDSAGRLLEKAGAKSFKTSKTEVWSNHANFIVNRGNADSENVLELMLKMYTAVKEKFTIELIPEIIFVGNKTDKEEEICKILYQKRQK